MQTPDSDFAVGIDASCLQLTSALVIRDICGLPVPEDTPDRIIGVPLRSHNMAGVDTDDWLSWWRVLLADVAAERLRPSYAGASERLIDLAEVSSSQSALRAAMSLEPDPGGLGTLHEASRQLVQEPQHGLRGTLHVVVLPSSDKAEIFTSGVLLLSHPVVGNLDETSALRMLREYASKK